MQELTGAEIVVESLIGFGVEYIAGVPGHTVLDLVEALRQRQDRITSIIVRNEESAGYIADAYYRLKHRPMAVVAHNSVGAANLLTGVMNAMLDSSAMIVITGEAWTRNQGRGAFQELSHARDAGTPDIFRGSVKRSWQVNRADKLLEVMLRAYKEAVSGRPGPVHIDITQEAFAQRVPVQLPTDFAHFVPDSKVRGSASATTAAFELLKTSERPVILAGGGTVRGRASAALIRLAEAMNIPVVTTSMGKGVIPDAHPLSLGVGGWVGTVQANTALREADVLLALGTRFSETDTAGWTDGAVFNIPGTKVIQVDIDPVEIARYYPIEVGIVGDVVAVIEDLTAAADASSQRTDTSAWFSTLERASVKWDEDVEASFDPDADPIEPGRLTRELRKALPEDGIMMTDVGNSQKWIIQQFPTYAPDTFITSLGGASMGFGPCGAPGAQLAAPDKRVAIITGDGSMSMSLHILPTLVEQGLPIVYVVANDYSYGSVKGPQDRRYGPGHNHFVLFEDSSGEPYKLDFAAVASAVGIASERVTKASELEAAFARAFAAGTPYLLDVEVRRETYVPMTGGGAYPLPTAE